MGSREISGLISSIFDRKLYSAEKSIFRKEGTICIKFSAGDYGPSPSFQLIRMEDK